MKKILILNHTRMGDLIQTTPLIAGLKEEYPDCHITLLGNVKFTGVCNHLEGIDRLIVLDIQQFGKNPEEGVPILDIYRYYDKLVAELHDMKFDILVNLSHSRLSAAMGPLLGIPDVRGFYSSDEGSRIINDPWMVYFSAFLSFRRYNTFNLVDIYQLAGGVKPKIDRGVKLLADGPRVKAKALMESLGLDPNGCYIGLQGGSSLKERRWPPDKFAATADLIAKERGATVLLFGTAGEMEVGTAIQSAMKEPCVNLLGKSSLEELVGLVSFCEMLLTNDTGTMHIAASVGTPSVGLFLVHAYGYETGPYAENHIVLQPDIDCFPCAHNTMCPHYACLHNITPEDAALAASLLPALASGKEVTVDDMAFSGTRAVASVFDEAGFLDFFPLKKKEPMEWEVFASLYREYLIGRAVGGERSGYGVKRLVNGWKMWDAERATAWVAKKKEIFGKLGSAAKNGEREVETAEKAYRKGNVEKVRAQSAVINAVDDEIAMLGNIYPELKPPIRLFEIGKENLQQEDVLLLLAKTKLLYRDILAMTGFMVTALDRLSKASRT